MSRERQSHERRDLIAWYDHVAAVHDEHRLPLSGRVANLVVHHAMIAEGSMVLDVGTGTGNVALAAAQHVRPRGRVIGVDFSQGMLDKARSRAGDLPVEFRRMDAETLEFADATFDVVVSSLLAGAHIVRVLREIRRVLRPGGRTVFAWYTDQTHEPVAGLTWSRLEHYRTVRPPSPSGHWTAIPETERFRSWFEQAGLAEIARLRWCGATTAGEVLERQTLDILRIGDGRLAEHWGARVEAAPKRYRAKDWIDSRVEIRPSSTHGRGTFARARIGAGDIVTIWGGTFVLTDDSLLRKQASGMGGWSLATVGDGRYLGRIVAEGEEDITNLLNHSCDPTLWMHDEVTLGARRDIYPGEELTLDYAMIEDDEDWSVRSSAGAALHSAGAVLLERTGAAKTSRHATVVTSHLSLTSAFDDGGPRLRCEGDTWRLPPIPGAGHSSANLPRESGWSAIRTICQLESCTEATS